MTDKEKRELKDGVISIFKRFNILDHTATIGGLKNDILNFIDSLQEEPSKFDTAIQEGDDVRYNEDLGCRVNLSQLKRIAKKEEPVSEELHKVSKEWLAPQLDKSYANYGEGKMMELTHFDGYAMLDAIEFGAKWQKEKEYTCYEEAFEDGAKWKKEQLIKEAIYGIARPEHGGVWCNLESFNFKDGDKVKVIVIKED